ncbi:Protein of unknown function [Marinobacter sp. DSM 26671]|jgi:hypothetical protein|uniref:DUF1631 domain-containing protein n=4 Tax=Marinobacter TaxID=2742 RepID=A0A3D8H4P8_9GAMM|nr:MULTISPECIES: DUF1631 domain-containing protein [Marinobacter]MCP4062976.1 DUF1631 domain-containing protein [Gammaproteobacteria bacterium]MCR9190779.1 DUF1631 domain-containing protein [Alteromonadaceae bacterium]MEC7727135.1 DUF1631 domain-containing protein [Pseudomonadota bacterium]EHJ03070.1 hypothetical protein KYE_18393 [Marinobacter manganoxydans MnI7-9]MAK48214.1 DUF1631 domain-containing protein [Marinobacter sp.]|tara:strand:+ start:3414 stop:5639 length:2226 start_codon:yes stop_codon:yes gene_type:complete
MNKQSGIHYLREHREAGSNRPVPAEVTRIRDTVVAGLGDLLQGAFDAVDDSLFELANNARSNNEQNRYFEAMREIRIKRKGVERHFQNTVAQYFATPPHTGPLQEEQLSKQASADTLALVGNDDLEEQVALNAMITKAKAHFQGPLLQLQTRFSQVYPEATDESPVNPMAPEHLCSAFTEAIQALEIQIRERLILLKQFDRYVVSNLGMLLDEANRILIQAGIIPNFRYHGKSGQQHEASSPQSAEAPKQESAPDASAAERAGQAASSSAVFEQIRQMLALQRANAGIPPRASDPNVRVVGDSELASLLNSLPLSAPRQDQGNLSAGEPVSVDLRQLVQQLLSQTDTGDGRKPALNEVDEDLINLVSMLFEFILDDYNLSAPVQVLISRLQIPILKVVIRDKSFFSQATHPARRLLNSLARAGIGWSSSDEKTKDKLYGQIHNIVQRILNEFDGDVSLFETLNQEFEQFLERENRKASLVEQRTRESERGRIKSQTAQQTVDNLLKQKVSRYKLPESIHDILMNGWSRVMFLAYLRDDVEHRWNATVKVVDDLIWCLHPHQEDDERDQWVRVVPGLLKSLRSGLEEVSYNSSRLDEMMGQLKHQLAEAFRTNAAIEALQDSPEEPAEEEIATVHQTAVERQQELEDAAISEYVAQIDGIEIGNWVEFRLVNGANFRCKLSAIIDEADCFVFVNRMGLKVIEKTRVELAHEMRRGRLTLLEQGALIDRALDAVVGTLRSKTA